MLVVSIIALLHSDRKSFHHCSLPKEPLGTSGGTMVEKGCSRHGGVPNKVISERLALHMVSSSIPCT